MQQKNATVAVVGAGDYIGSAIAERFAAEGYTVFAGRRNGDQLATLKGKIEATVQTVVTAQELWLKAALVDREQLAVLQQSCDLVAAEELFRGAFWRDVRPRFHIP